MKDFPYTDLQRKWIDDLKTTYAPQTRHTLHRLREVDYRGQLLLPGYCCLGRACVVAGLKEESHDDISMFIWDE